MDLDELILIDSNVVHRHDIYKDNRIGRQNILNDCEFANEDEKFLVNDIIANLEEFIKVSLDAGKIVRIPSNGNIRLDELTRTLMRHNMTIDQFKIDDWHTDRKKLMETYVKLRDYDRERKRQEFVIKV